MNDRRPRRSIFPNQHQTALQHPSRTGTTIDPSSLLWIRTQAEAAPAEGTRRLGGGAGANPTAAEDKPKTKKPPTTSAPPPCRRHPGTNHRPISQIGGTRRRPPLATGEEEERSRIYSSLSAPISSQNRNRGIQNLLYLHAESPAAKPPPLLAAEATGRSRDPPRLRREREEQLSPPLSPSRHCRRRGESARAGGFLRVGSASYLVLN